jgi:hypothetical protein
MVAHSAGEGWRKDGRKRVGRLYIAGDSGGKGSRGVEAGVDGATPLSANAQESLGEEGGGVQYGGACRDDWG